MPSPLCCLCSAACPNGAGVDSDVTPRSRRDGVRRSGSPLRAKCVRSSAGTRAVAATHRRTKRTTSTSTSGRRMRLGADRRSLRSICTPCEQDDRAAQALALAGQQLTQAKASAMPDECIRILESKVQQGETAMKQAQPLGQKMDQSTSQISSSR